MIFEGKYFSCLFYQLAKFNYLVTITSKDIGQYVTYEAINFEENLFLIKPFFQKVQTNLNIFRMKSAFKDEIKSIFNHV